MQAKDLLTLVSGDSPLRKVATSKGGEYAGPCPLCGGRDRLRVWPEHKGGQWWCRQCGKGGDAIAYQVELGDLSPAEAGKMRRGESGGLGTSPAAAAPPPTPRHPGRLAPPGPDWQASARALVTECTAALWAPEGARALAWLQGRGLTDETIQAAGLGYNNADRYDLPEAWGLEPWTNEKGKPGRVYSPRGVVIPWEIGGDLWRVNIRRPRGEPKYQGPKGAANGLYNAEALSSANPAMLVEGEIDALTLGQVAGDLVTPVATGSTGGARRPRWIGALSLCPAVLVAYDADDAGTRAAAWWVGVLANSRRWRPIWGDANAMHQDGADLRAWVAVALGDKTPDPAPTTGFSDRFPTAAVTAPPWAGQRVRIEDLPEFKARWGLQVVGGEWAEGAPCPTLTMRG